jgi:hypothetical protein
MKTTFLKIVISVTIAFAFQKASAQNNQLNSAIDSSLVYRIDSTKILAEIILKDGNILRGNILKQSIDSITINSSFLGLIILSRKQILSIKFFNPESKGNQQVYTNLASRYFFSPSAINMKKGDGYYQNTWFSFHSFNYAVSDYVTLGGGFEMFSLLLGHPIITLTPKVSIPINKNWHVGAGILYLNVLGSNVNSNGITTVYGNITYGNNQSNISINAGTSLDYPGKPILTINGFHQISPKFGIMTENWLTPTNESYYNIYTLGGRIIGRKNCFDFGLITNPDIAKFILGIPFLSYTLKF